MANIGNVEMDFYNDLRAVCKQICDEYKCAYNYFEKKGDYNGIFIFSSEISRLYELFALLDKYNPANRTIIAVPNSYDWTFYHYDIIKKATSYADQSVVLAYGQRDINSENKLYLFNGSFYGYYCYNTLTKCFDWVKFSINKFALNTVFKDIVVDYISKSLRFFM
ncbi:MAG: hypothetical protein IJS67_03370, partial [Clostridia bacterium]|nr:hypothetical protein [Clostridia bacterium]